MEWPENENVKTHFPKHIQDEIKTARQWAASGYVPISPECGCDLYPNGHRQGMRHYYHSSEVREGTEKELADFFAPERARRAQMAKVRKDRIEQELDNELRDLLQAQTQAAQLNILARKNYRTLCSHQAHAPADVHIACPLRVVIDAETTGLDVEVDEILQLSIIDADTGETVLNEYFRPFHTAVWLDAQAVNGITPGFAAKQNFFVERAAVIQAVLHNASEVIGYNTDFDLRFLQAHGINLHHVTVYHDVMQMYADISNVPWCSLISCAYDLGYDWGVDQAHDSLADCRATLYCFNKILEGGI